MDNINFNKLIDNALHYYDTKMTQYRQYIIKQQNTNIDRDKQTVTFPVQNHVFKYELLGVFDNSTDIWIWAWMIPDFKYNETLLVKKLLNYGLKICPSGTEEIQADKLYLRTQLTNSRFILNTEFQLELHLAISLYLIKDNAKFIHPVKVKLTNEKYITVYYIII